MSPDLRLGRDEVHVWRIRLDRTSAGVDAMTRVLSPAERERAGRFRFKRDRRRFIVRHAALRRLLASYLDADPAGLEFSPGPHGKPSLGGRDRDSLSFNMSHSNELALVAVARTGALGVDVEWRLRDVDCMEIARQFFLPREAEMLSALDGAERRRRFFSLWTRKEARLKAAGCGLQLPMRHALDTPGWSTFELTPAPEYVGAIVREGPAGPIREREAVLQERRVGRAGDRDRAWSQVDTAWKDADDGDARSGKARLIAGVDTAQ